MEDATPDWLIQHSRLRGETRAVALTGNRLQVASQSLFGRRRYAIHLAVLAAEPHRRRYLAWRWLLAAGGGLGLAGLLWWDSVARAGTTVPGVPLVVALLALVGGLGALATFFYRSYSLDEYRTRFAGCTVCALHRGRPDRRAYQRFTRELQRQIETAQETLGNKRQRGLAAELRELRRLTQEGAVPEQAYEHAKGAILSRRGRAAGVSPRLSRPFSATRRAAACSCRAPADNWRAHRR